MREMEVG
jgi:hypothetical protein